MRILFVDDETRVLNGLKRSLRPMSGEWEMEFSDDPGSALKQMESREFDIIISDMNMPGIGGRKLMAAVKERYPRMVRIIMSGLADGKEGDEAHLYLDKPCDRDTLIDAVRTLEKQYLNTGQDKK